MSKVVVRTSFIADELRGKIHSQLCKGVEVDLLFEINSHGFADTANFPTLDYPQLCSINGRLRKAGIKFQFVTLPKDRYWHDRYIFLEAVK